MEQSQKFKILRAYLGHFFVPVPKETRAKFAEKFTSKELTRRNGFKTAKG